MRDMCRYIRVSSDAPIPHCAGCQKMSVVRSLCFFFFLVTPPLPSSVLGLPAATPRPRLNSSFFDLFQMTLKTMKGLTVFRPAPLYTGCARRGEDERMPFFSLEEDDRSSIVSLHSLRSRPQRLVLHRTPASVASAAAGSIVFPRTAFLYCRAAVLSSALCVFVIGGKQAFSRVGVFVGLACPVQQGCAHSAAFSSHVAQFQSHAIQLCQLMRAGCCAERLSPRFRLLLIPVSHTSLEGLPRKVLRLRRPSGPGCTQRRWL